MSLRSRVALAAMVATVLTVVVAGFAVLALTKREQVEDLDRQLATQVELVRRQGAIAALIGERALPPRVGREDLNLGLLVLDGDGAELYASDGFPSVDEVPPAGYSTLEEQGANWRVLSTRVRTPFRQGGADLTVLVGASMDGVDATVAGLRRLLIVLGGVAVVGAGGGGWLLATVAIRPLAELRREAERVTETADLSVRVPAHQGPSEVDELARSLNTMLERIESGAAQTQSALDASRAFAGNVAHELRTPLTSMQTNLEVLAANPELAAEDRAAIVEDVVAQQRRLLDALEALRLLARGELAAADLFEETNLADLVDGVVAQARVRYPEATIELDVREEPVGPAAVWPEGVRVMLDNLIRNAVTHGAPASVGGAEVTVALGFDEESWELSVLDGGAGIAEEERGRVTERFARGRGARSVGTGLGLALVAQQAELHGGELEIGDAPGGGARVTVRAPLRRRG